MAEHDDHWLTRPTSIRRLWVIGLAVLALTVAAEPFVDRHPHFDLEAAFGFNAWYGLLTCAAMVVAAKGLGVFLKRTDRYYDE